MSTCSRERSFWAQIEDGGVVSLDMLRFEIIVIFVRKIISKGRTSDGDEAERDRKYHCAIPASFLHFNHPFFAHAMLRLNRTRNRLVQARESRMEKTPARPR
jgi:hypothetical protein